MTAPTSELQYVIRDNQAVGFLLSAGPKGYRAFDADGLTLGLYESEELAAKAINEQTSNSSTSRPFTAL
jgi:hypothetical protein